MAIEFAFFSLNERKEKNKTNRWQSQTETLKQ